MSLYKHGLAIFVLTFSMSAVAVEDLEDLTDCPDLASMEEYNKWHKYMKKYPNDALIKYIVALISLCVGKKYEGLYHLQVESDFGYIPATYLLGIYYEYNSSESPTRTLEDLHMAIYQQLIYHQILWYGGRILITTSLLVATSFFPLFTVHTVTNYPLF